MPPELRRAPGDAPPSRGIKPPARPRSPSMRPEPRNPLYLLLLAVGLLFVITALAVAVIPALEQKALEQGTAPPPSPFRDALRQDGWKWLLWEVAALIVL